MEILLVILSMLSTAGIGTAIYFFTNTKKLEVKLSDPKYQEMTEDIAIERASTKAKNIILEAQQSALDIRNKAEKHSSDLTNLVEEKERRLDDREQALLTRSKSIDDRYKELEKQEKAIEQAKADVKKNKETLRMKLEEVAGLSRKEAEERLIKEIEEGLMEYSAKKIREAESKIESEVEDKAKNLLIDTMQKSATDYVAETTSTTFDIESEELKGKIIGKDGRNIRSFERLTGVDIIIDEAPNQVTVSSFDPIRREVAALAITKLLKDGRVHPGTIESTIQAIKEDLAKEIKKTGEKMAYDAGCNDLPIEIIKLLGRFKYRFSYGQNLVKHTLEMVNIGQQIAQEIGADIQFVRKACLLHDIGKVLTHEIEGKPHHHISGDIVRKYLKDENLANAVESHHGDIKPASLEAVILQIADAISGSRPGARRDNYEDYIQRIKELEDIANKHPEVKQAYAIYAGREIRVIVDPNNATDDEAKVLAHKIAKEIEETQNYPGTVRINVIREVRFTEEAK